ncbi:hypothetical protein VTK73DRAFT_83 [Phialemonium thermophilum]|uniref:HECT-type E3 ubiquitin transferase n=1 Tax=Phialemonium thermophilum TaxID=223376 RepID=A0ABR3YA96_9PEZI
MGKITKPMQQKHKETLSPWLKEYVHDATLVPLPLLPQHLDKFPSRWPFPRGDLYHWIPLLNRFDDILAAVCATYNLNDGPQMREFGCDVLLNKGTAVEYGDGQAWDMGRLLELGYGQDGDRHLVVAVLKFSRMLLEHCGNRSIYASSTHLNDLLNTPHLDIIYATLQVGVELAQRYQASVKRMASPSRQLSSALLANHYNIELEKVQFLAQSFVKTPIFKFADVPPTTPASTGKGKEKAHAGSHRNVTSMYANDLVSLAAPEATADSDWNGWGDVKVIYYPNSASSEAQHPSPSEHPVSGSGPGASSNSPSTPTPLRRGSTTPRGNRQASADDSSPVHPRTPAPGHDGPVQPGHKLVEVPHSAAVSTSVYDLLSRCPPEMPKLAKYEFLNRVRVSKALLDSPETRQQALAVRLLAITNLAYIHPEPVFLEKVLRHDNDEPRRYQLVYQLAELIHPSADGSNTVPLWLQAIALTTLEAVSNLTARYSDVLSALNANVNHGVLLYVIRKAVAGMRADREDEQLDKVTEEDEWRNALFSLTLHMAMGPRVGVEMISAGLMDILVEILNLRTRVSTRYHSMMLAFLDGLIYGYQGAFQSFASASGLDCIAQLTIDTVSEAAALARAGKGTARKFHAHTVDYEIPFYQQQTLKWLLKFLHHVLTNSYSYGGNTDRLLRNLVDNSQLLGSIRTIIESKELFGSVVWTNSVTLLSDFINNDPTSFAAIAESGMIKSFLEVVTNRPVKAEPLTRQASDGDQNQEPSSPEEPTEFQNNPRPHPPATELLARQKPRDGPVATGILPSSEAMSIIPVALNSISLNNAGLKMVVSSQALETFLEVFESPEHVRCMEADPDLPTALGNSFDELARHHPALRPSISNAILNVSARLVYLARQEPNDAGVRLLVSDPEGKSVSADKRTIPFWSSAGASSAKGNEKAVAVPGDSDVEMADAGGSATNGGSPKTANDSTSPSQSVFGSDAAVTPFIGALSSFLTQAISNSNLKSAFICRGGIELLLDLADAPSLPYDFGESGASRTLSQILSQLIEASPILGLPAILNRLQDSIDALRPLVNMEGSHPFFAPFLDPDFSPKAPSGELDPELVWKVSSGTSLVKSLLNTQTLIKILYQCFPYSNRHGTSTLPSVNVFDYYTRLIKSLGPLLRTVLAEEMSIAHVVPQRWSNRKLSDLEERLVDVTPSDAVTSVGGVGGATHSDEAGASALAERTSQDIPSHLKKPSAEEVSSPAYQNYQVLRVLLHSLMPTTLPFFQTIGKALLPRRERDTYIRSHHMSVAEALAATILEQLKPSGRETTMKDMHYWIVMLHTVQEMLVDPTRHSERSTVQIILPVLNAFKEQGGLDTLNRMLLQFSEDICKEPADSGEESKSKLAAMGMKKILDLYLLIVHGKNIIDSMTQITLYPRSIERRTDVQTGPQLVVELRMAILPVIKTLWASPLVEKASTQVLTKVIDILKTIATADQETHAYRRSDKPAPPLTFKRDPVLFNWSAVADELQSLSATYGADLAQEALYRANGKRDDAVDYCQAVEKKAARRRNPIPEDEKFQNVPSSKTASSSNQTPAFPAAGGANTSDAMALDSLPEIDRLIGDAIGEAVFGELGDHSSGNGSSEDEEESSVRSVLNAVPSAPTNLAGEASASDPTQVAEERAQVTKDDLDGERAELREDLIDRCLDVIRAHPDSVFEVSELIETAILKPENDEKRAEVGDILANALMSFAMDDEIKKSSGASIAAYAHLLALLLQDKAFYAATVKTVKEYIGDYLSFLRLSPANSHEELPPWIPHILLIFEILLTADEQPVEVRWKPPSSEDDVVEEPRWEEKEPNLGSEDRVSLMEAVLDILPRIGKDSSLAVSVLRVLVVLTRDRSIAKTVGERKNLQRLFVMAKQLCGAEASHLRDSGVTRSLLIVLRHIVEDEDIIRQIMRAEIQTYMENFQRSSRPHDVPNFIRHLSHVAMRAPKLFVEVATDMVKLVRWSPPGSDALPRHQITLSLKDEGPSSRGAVPEDSSVEPAVQATEDLTIDDDVKPTTESGEPALGEAPRTPGQDLKRPVLENPDGVIHFLLCELLNYKDVDDKDASPQPSKESKAGAEVSSAGPGMESASDQRAEESKDKKGPKQIFRAEEHPIFIYRCFLLHCLAELLQSYNRTKVEFINFKRSAPVQTNTPIKPRSSVLNYLLNDVLCLNSLSANVDSIALKKKAATASQAQQVLVALVAKTGEKPVDRQRDAFLYDDEPDLLFVRKFVLDTVLKAYKEASTPNEPFDIRYAKMLCLAELMSQMIGEKDNPNPRGTDPAALNSQLQLKRLMYEKGYLSALTSSIADIDLTFPNVKRTIKYILRVLRMLTKTATQLSKSDLITSTTADNADDDIISASSLSDIEDDREETPDLYRNSTLGMLEPGREDDFSEDSEDDDEEMYDEEFGDELDYGDDMSADDENVSDEDEELGEMGNIEGLPGDPNVVEVIMGEDDDDDDDDDEDDDMDDDDDEDEPSDEDEEDEDDMGSEDMEDDEDQIEIYDEGNPVGDDGGSDWESDSDGDEGDEEEIDYEAEAQDLDEQVIDDQMGRFGNLMRAAMEADDLDGEDVHDFGERYVDDGAEEDDEDDQDDEVDDDDYYYDQDYPHDDPVSNMPAGLGWDTLVLDHGAHRHRHHHHGGIHSPFPGPPFMVGGPRDPLSEFRNYFRTPRGGPASHNPEDSINPLLRRRHPSARDSSPRPSNPNLLRLGFPHNIVGSAGLDGPLAFINDLVASLPIQGRPGHALHFQITHQGPRGEVRELHIPVGGGSSHQQRDTRSDLRRDLYQEPLQVVSFVPVLTLERWQQEARMVFGHNYNEKTTSLYNMVLGKLTPAAIQREKELKARQEEERMKREEEKRKREEEERKQKEAKEAEERAAREKKEVEERERAEREAAEAVARPSRSDESRESQAMEGVEATGANEDGGEGATQQQTQRVVTTIRGETVDVTELGIDPEYLAALPEEFREEVIAQAVTSRRSQAREAADVSGENTEVFQEFLEALPEELRQEIIQQERQERRRRERDEQRRQAAAAGHDVGPQDMDTASILLTFPPALREQVLMDQGEDLMDHLPPELAAEARALTQRHAAQRAPPALTRGARDAPRQFDAGGAADNKGQRRQVVQMLDKAGIATLLRLMFVSQQGSIRNALFDVLVYVCENRQNRLEVISTVLQILQDGSTDMDAVERSFGQLSLKAKQPKDRDPRTPSSLKKPLTGVGAVAQIQGSSEVSPLLVVQQCLDLLVELCKNNLHVPSLFLTEHETVAATLKRSLSRKSKGRDVNSKAQKYAINALLGLLDRSLVMESSSVMQLLADLLNKVTFPLQALERRRREAEEEAKKTKQQQEESKDGETQAGAAASGEQVSSVTRAPDSADKQPAEQTQQNLVTSAQSAEAESSEAHATKAAPSEKNLRQLTPPYIPEHNLRLVINIFVARECSSKTFQNTISAIKNLSYIENAKRVFGEELVRQARVLSENIVKDLDDLLPHILKAESGTEIQGVALAKFSPGASEQNKLLRVLTALDHLFDSKTKKSDGSQNESSDKETAKDDLLGSLYYNPTFGKMWEKLSACLSAIRQKENMLNVATILLPLIESLMVVCKNTTLEDAPTSQTAPGKEMLLSSPPPENRIAGLFFTFTEEHRRILNELVRQNPKLMSGTFSLLVKNPKVLEFDNKRNYFNRSVHSKTGHQQTRPSFPPLQLSVRREHVFHDSYRSLYFKSGDEMKYGKLNIRFHGEEGVDAGGVTREWFQVLARQMFDPNYALFIPVSSDRTTFHPNKLSAINDEHLMFFKFIGRIIGKALYEGRLLDCYFSRAVYKRILGKPVSVKDMESFDLEYYKSLTWMLENNITGVFSETFSVEDDEFGVVKTVDLCENGRNIPVTEENKHEYVRLVVEHKLLTSVKDQMEHFLKGFHEIIPAELISIFNEQELELLISGLPDIDVDDWKSNTEYHNYTAASPQIQWFWRAVRSFDKEERAKLLQFVTGTSKVPLNGFKELEGMNGINRFNIHRDYGSTDRLPSSHTCFNQLDLPEYESYEILRTRLLKAITAGSDYFGFA